MTLNSFLKSAFFFIGFAFLTVGASMMEGRPAGFILAGAVVFVYHPLLQLDKCVLGNLWRAAIARSASAIWNGTAFVKKFYWVAVEKLFYWGGMVAFIIGVGKIYKPLGWIVAGLITYTLALMINRARGLEETTKR